MGEFHPHDRLTQSCREAPRYPTGETLLKRNHSRKELDEYANRLDKDAKIIFSSDDSKTQVRFWDLLPGGKGFTSTTTRNASALRTHLVRDQKDPSCRLVFIESDHSRASLNCPKAMFLFLLTYEQVSPSFLDNIFTFGEREHAVDTCLSQYRYDDTLGPSTRQPAIVALGRSGLEIRETFLLRGVEWVASTSQWAIRQMALYLSFDIVSGKTLLIVVKGNNVMQQRIAEDSADMLAAKGSHEDGAVGLFEMSLLTLLSCVRWCEEGWRWFIRDVDKDIRPTLVKGRTAPIRIPPPSAPGWEPAPGPGPHFRGTLPTDPCVTPVATGVFEKRESAHRRPGHGSLARAWHVVRGAFGLSQPSKPEVEENASLVLPPTDMFNYQDLQKLYVSGQNIEEAILTLHLLTNTLQVLAARHQDLVDNGWDNLDGSDWTVLDEERIRGFKAATRPFLTKLRGSIRSLEGKRDQLMSLQKRLQEGKTLFEELLHLQNLEAGRMQAERSRESALAMQDIARRTEQETFSMRVLTVAALVFLPPTFVASFFQSGILEWRETPDITDPWNLRLDAFKLYVSICVPMTVVTFAFWFLASIQGPRVVQNVSRPEVSPGERLKAAWWRTAHRDSPFLLPV